MSDNKTAKKPEVIKVKAESINVNSLGTLGRTNGTATRKADNTSKQQWATTALILHAIHPLETFDVSKDVSDIAEDIRKVLKDHWMDTYEEFPATGKNSRTGQVMEVCDKNGDPKWSSWEETRNPISYCGDLATVVKAGMVEQFIISDTSVLAKGAILKLAKEKQPAIKTIQASCEMIGKKIEELNLTDLETAVELISAQLSATIARRDENKKALEAE